MCPKRTPSLAPFLEGPSLDNGFDILENIVGFVPLGFLFCACFSAIRPGIRAAFIAVAAGITVSLIIETLQVYLPTRDSDLTDVITNALGTVIGALLFYTRPAKALIARIRECDRLRNASPNHRHECAS